MKLYNKGHRAFILNKADVISGCEPLAHDMNKDRVYFNPGSEAELKDEVGERMSKQYSTELMQVDKNRIKKTKTTRLAKKPAKKAAKK